MIYSIIQKSQLEEAYRLNAEYHQSAENPNKKSQFVSYPRNNFKGL